MKLFLQVRKRFDGPLYAMGLAEDSVTCYYVGANHPDVKALSLHTLHQYGDPDGVHWHVDNLSVHDGSLFPTSIGANPQLSIYGLVAQLATQLAKRLSGRDVALA